jgi:hypothetical protein
MSAWSDLSNAAHIDGVIASLKEYPEIWAETWDAVRGATLDATWIEAWCTARHAAHDEDWDAVWGATLNAAYDAAWNAAWNAADVAPASAAWNAIRDAACNAASSAFLALVAYDDCEQYLNLPSEQLRAWSLLTEHPAAVLLLPAVVVFERIKELKTA